MSCGTAPGLGCCWTHPWMEEREGTDAPPGWGEGTLGSPGVQEGFFSLSFPCWCPIFPLLPVVPWGKLPSVTLAGAGPVGIAWRQWEIPHGAALLQRACGQNSRCPGGAWRSSAQSRQFWGGGKRHHQDLIPGFRFQRGIFALLISLTRLAPIPGVIQPHSQALEGNSDLPGGRRSPGSAAPVPIPDPLDAPRE